MKLAPTVVIALTASLLSLLFACERMETERTHFETFKEAFEQNMVGEGRLLPPIVPDSATNIDYAFNVDTNDAWITFAFAPDDADEVTSRCGERAMDSRPSGPRHSPLAKWPAWFVVTDGAPSAPPAGWMVRQCADDGSVAVNPADGLAAYWRKD